VPEKLSEGQDSCPGQTASHQRSAVLDDPRREAVHGRTRYLLDNARKEAADRFVALSALFDPTSTRHLERCGVGPEWRLETQIALLRLLEDHGVNRLYGRLLYGALRSHGLVNVDAEGRVLMLRHGSPGEPMLRANYMQSRSEMVDEGYISGEQVEADLKRLQEPHFAMPSAVMWSAIGRRPCGIGGQ
jgi:hypothetical protein